MRPPMPWDVFHGRVVPSLEPEALTQLVREQLHSCGWTLLCRDLFLRDRLFETTSPRSVECVQARMQHRNDEVVLSLRSSVVRYVPFRISSLLCREGHQELFERGGFVDLRTSNFPFPCCVVPNLTRAHIIGLSKDPPPFCKQGLCTEQNFRDYWKDKYSLSLSDTIDGYLHIQFSRASPLNLIYPSCCVWTASGLTEIPSKLDTPRRVSLAQTFVRDVQGTQLPNQTPALILESDGPPSSEISTFVRASSGFLNTHLKHRVDPDTEDSIPTCNKRYRGSC